MLLHVAQVCANESWKLFQFFLSLCFSPLCSVDDVLGQSLDEVIRQGLLDPLVPYLTSQASGSGAITGNVAGVSNANSNSVTSGSGGGISNTAASVTSGGQRSLAASVVASGCSAAESSSKEEEERDLSRQG